MRMQFYQCLIVVILPYFVIASDADNCKMATSTGFAIGCTAATTLAGVGTGLACTVGAVFTFGASCAVALVGTAAIGGGCAAGGYAASKGKEIIQI